MISKQIYKIAKQLDYQISLDKIENILNNPQIGYGYYDKQNNIVVDDNDINNPLPDSAFDNYKLQSYETILKYKLGVCWDSTLVIDKILNDFHIKHVNLFLYGGGDQYTTHTTTICKNNNVWQWIDGSWKIFRSNNYIPLKSENMINIIKIIKSMHQEQFNQKDNVYIINQYPTVGSNAQQFINFILQNGTLLNL